MQHEKYSVKSKQSIKTKSRNGLAAIAASIAIISAALVGGSVSLSSEAQAQVTIPVILVIDRGRLMSESEAGKNITEQAVVLRETITAELEKKYSEFEKEQKQLEAQVDVISQEVLQKRAEELNSKAQILEREKQMKNREYQASVVKASGKISEALEPILVEILKSRSATILMDKSQVLFTAPEIDITADAMQKLNEAIKEVKLERVKIGEDGLPIDDSAAKKNN